MSRRLSDKTPTWLLLCAIVGIAAALFLPGLTLAAFGAWIVEWVRLL